MRSHFQLDNGLRLVVERDQRLPLVAINLWYHVGSKNEAPGSTGLAHLFEHMLFQGSQNVSTNGHFEHVQRVGGVANGSTWYDRTNYYETLPSHQLELGLWLESDRMGFLLPALTSDKLENQRSVVMNERRQRVDNQPYGGAMERLHEALYPLPHPYHWPVIGTMADIESASLEQVQSFFRTHYRPSNAVLTLVGDVDVDGARQLVEAYFGDLTNPQSSPDRTPGHSEASGTTTTVEDDVRLPRSYIAHRVAGFGDDEWFAALLLATILSDGKSSRLYRELVHELERAQTVSTYAFPTELCATFLTSATAREAEDPSAALEVLERHVQGAVGNIAKSGVTASELARARRLLLVDEEDLQQSFERRADRLNAYATYRGDADAADGHTDRILAVSEEAVRALAERLYSETPSVVRVVPRAAS